MVTGNFFKDLGTFSLPRRVSWAVYFFMFTVMSANPKSLHTFSFPLTENRVNFLWWISWVGLGYLLNPVLPDKGAHKLQQSQYMILRTPPAIVFLSARLCPKVSYSIPNNWDHSVQKCLKHSRNAHCLIAYMDFVGNWGYLLWIEDLLVVRQIYGHN